MKHDTPQTYEEWYKLQRQRKPDPVREAHELREDLPVYERCQAKAAAGSLEHDIYTEWIGATRARITVLELTT